MFKTPGHTLTLGRWGDLESQYLLGQSALHHSRQHQVSLYYKKIARILSKKSGRLLWVGGGRKPALCGVSWRGQGGHGRNTYGRSRYSPLTAPTTGGRHVRDPVVTRKHSAPVSNLVISQSKTKVYPT